MRFITGGIMHETHTFATEPTPLDAFIVLRGEEVFAWRGVNHSLGGVIDACEMEGIDLAPTLFATALAAAPPSSATLELLLTELVDRIAAALPTDGIVLTLHGAMVTDQFPDADAEIIRRVRLLTDGRVPIAVTLDLHANIGPAMLDGISVITGYDTYPHVDCNDRAQEAVRLLAATVAGVIHPTLAYAQPPLVVVPQAIQTNREPFLGLFDRVHALEERPDVLSITCAGGFAYSDVPHAGISFVVTCDSNAEAAQQIADELAELAWSMRHDMLVTNIAPEAAVASARSAPECPVVLVDVGDNIGGGTPGDGTVLLAELLRQGATGAVVVINDPESASAAIAAGVGREVDLQIGGKTDLFHGLPVVVTGMVRSVSDGRWIHDGPENEGVPVDMGPTAVVDVAGVAIVLTTHKTAPGDLQQLISQGIDPTQQRIIVVKAAVRWRGGYGPICKESIHVDTPGLGSVNLHQFSFIHLRRPIFPLDNWTS